MQFEKMDEWTSDEVCEFKECAANPPADELTAAALEAQPAKWLVAEGDSWFDYLPGTDLIDCLRSHYDYRIDNYASAGDTLENMVYGTAITRDHERAPATIRRVLRRVEQVKPRVFLFSGGGNDVAGDEFESYLNHAATGLPPVRVTHAKAMINNVFRKCLTDLIEKIRAVSPETHIVMHGYGHSIPDGRGVNFLFIRWTGPWLLPALARKRWFAADVQRRAVAFMIDSYNDMLALLDQDHDKFHYVDLRPLIVPERDWVNELHLKNSAFARAAQKIHETIAALP